MECLLEDSEEELDKSLLVRRHSPMLSKGKLKREDNESAQGHKVRGRARTKSKALYSKSSPPYST